MTNLPQPPASPPNWRAGSPFLARYDDWCARCHQPITKGSDTIAVLLDDSEYVHTGCAA